MTRRGADLLVSGRIASLGGSHGPAWVEAIAVRDGLVVAAGRRGDVEAAAIAGTTRLNLSPDEVAIPGLTDSHLHLADAALAARRIDLRDTPTLEAGLEQVRGASQVAADPAAWLEGQGWDADRWGGWPTAGDLERMAPGRLVALWAHDHHALWVSVRALAEAGITDETPDPHGGVIRRDANGRPTGVLHEAAARLVTTRIPAKGEGEVADAVEAFGDELVGRGVVAVHDPGGLAPRADLEGALGAYRRLAAAGRLPVRLHACIRPEQLEAASADGIRSGQSLGPDPLGRLRLGWLKAFADGTLGSRTAALLEPFEAPPGEPTPPNDGLGVWLTEPGELARLARRAADAGVATQVHAIGDAAVRAALDALAATAGRTALMPRVEHAQLVAAVDLPRFASLGVAASVQPIHVRTDAAQARRLWGTRAELRGYPYASLASGGAVVCLGTDAPVEPPDPWPGIACAVTRASPSWPEGTPAFGPSEALTLWRAIRGACLDPAISAGERDRGRLVPGSRADLVILPAAALEEPVEVDGALWRARPIRVLVDGREAAGG